MPLRPYDAIVLMSFGGPEKPDDVVPFLRRVTEGRGIPDERLEEVGEHYYLFGGRSPINDQNLALRAALRAELELRGTDYPVVWGNRNWEPFGDDVLRELAQTGARRVLMIVTSAFGSYSGCRQYREDVGRYDQILRGEGYEVVVDKIRPYFNHPSFADANARAIAEAHGQLRRSSTAPAHLMFVTHSIPTTMEAASGAKTPGTYSEQHLDLAQHLADRAAAETGEEIDWSLVYCSRSGPPHVPWLEPDINDALRDLADRGTRAVIASPFGFVSDHMEVIYDLDTEAAETAEEVGIEFVRAGTVGTDDAFVSGLIDMCLERAAEARGETTTPDTVGSLGPWRSVCAPDCCLRRHEQPSGAPALCGQPDTPLASTA